MLFTRTDDIGGWSFDQALVIIGLYEFIGGIVATFLQPNVRRIVSMIRDGTMDFVISKPVNSLFLSALRHSRLSALMQIVAGAAIFIVALRRLQYVPDATAVSQFVIMLLVAVALVFSIWILIATIAFVAVKVDEMGELFNSLSGTGEIPDHHVFRRCSHCPHLHPTHRLYDDLPRASHSAHAGLGVFGDCVVDGVRGVYIESVAMATSGSQLQQRVVLIQP